MTNAEGITTIAPAYAITQAQQIIGEDGKGAGTCAIKFQVFEGLDYDVLATGSKMTLAGFVFDTTGDATITLEDDDTNITLLENGHLPGAETAVKAVKAVAEDGAAYNAAGQQVSASFKGLVIKNGKKFIQK